MMKMLIKLDEERIKADEKYDLADMWRKIDEQFEKACTKELQPDGAALYSGDPNKNYYATIMLAYMRLSEDKSFAKYCSKWIWYSNDDNESLPMQDTDVLAMEQKDNALFG